MRVAYCGYDFFYTCLEEILRDGHELVELFTWPTDNAYDFNDEVLRIAQKEKARITFSPINELDLERLRKLAVDLLICAAYPYKVPAWEGFVRYAINVHPSLLPEGRGPWPLPWVILKGLRHSGVTLHAIGPSWDGGDIITQDVLDVADNETLESLSLRSQMLATNLVRETTRDIETRWAQKKPQRGVASYWKMPQRVNRTIDWYQGVEAIERMVRAFSKFEAFVYIDGVRHFVRKVDVWKAECSLEPGTLVHRSNRELVFAASDGLVALSNYAKAD